MILDLRGFAIRCRFYTTADLRTAFVTMADYKIDGRNGEVNSPLQQKESTAKSGCATKDRDAGLPGKSNRDAESPKARR